MAYCTIYDVGQLLGINDYSDSALLNRFVGSAQKAIDTYCGRSFEATADSTRYFDAREAIGKRLWVGELAAITTVEIDGTELASTEYVTEPRNETPYHTLRIKRTSVYSWGDNNTSGGDYESEDAIAITGRWAYSTSAPADIAQAAIMLAAYYYRQKDIPFQDVTAVEAGVVVRPVGIPAYIKVLLNPYRKAI